MKKIVEKEKKNVKQERRMIIMIERNINILFFLDLNQWSFDEVSIFESNDNVEKKKFQFEMNVLIIIFFNLRTRLRTKSKKCKRFDPFDLTVDKITTRIKVPSYFLHKLCRINVLIMLRHRAIIANFELQTRDSAKFNFKLTSRMNL